MIRRCNLPGLWVLALLAGSVPALAQTPAATQDKLKTVETRLSQQQAAAAALAQQAQLAGDSVRSLQAQLIAAAALLDSRQAEAQALQDRQDRLAADIEAKRHDLTAERKLLAELTEAMLNLGRQPPASLVLETGLTDTTIHRSIVLRAVLPKLRERADSLLRDLALLAELKAQLAEQQRLTAAGQANLAAQTRSLDQLIRARQGSLRQTEGQKAAIAAQLVALTSEAHDLRQLMERVTPPAGKTGRGKAGAERGPAPALKWPVAGHVLRGFGDRDTDGVTSQGVTFTALPGAPVAAPAAGTVAFAGPFKGYGQIVILQHQGGYHSFLAGLGRIDAEVGQALAAGEPLGVMPVVKPGAPNPELYFEWRRQSEPVDPSVARIMKN